MRKKGTMMDRWKKRAACLLMACLVLCCGCGEKEQGMLLIGSAQEQAGGDASGESPGDSAGQEESRAQEESATIRVYVCGAVANPGVVEIPQGSRVEDALLAAGGFGDGAGREAVNLADWVSDGQKLYFPTEEEAEQVQVEASEEASGLVNINTADAAALCTLPGIGESRARDIISYREANGGFESCEDIMKVSGIKTAAYEKIKDKITVR